MLCIRRDIETSEKILEVAKLQKADYLSTVTGVYIGNDINNEDMKLMEIDEQNLQYLLDGNRFDNACRWEKENKVLNLEYRFCFEVWSYEVVGMKTRIAALKTRPSHSKSQKSQIQSYWPRMYCIPIKSTKTCP